MRTIEDQMTEALEVADRVIKAIQQENGVDYSPVRQEIADFFDGTLWEGNWDSVLELEELPSLHFIQEDEYDQSMDDDDKPDEDSMIGLIESHYIFTVEG